MFVDPAGRRFCLDAELLPVHQRRGQMELDRGFPFGTEGFSSLMTERQDNDEPGSR